MERVILFLDSYAVWSTVVDDNGMPEWTTYCLDIGCGFHRSQILGNSDIKKMVQSMKAAAEETGAGSTGDFVVLFGEPVRAAQDGYEFLQEYKRLGYPKPVLLSVQDEVRSIARHYLYRFPECTGPCGIVYITGDHVHVIRVSSGSIQYSASLPIGIARLPGIIPVSDPPTQEEQNEIRNHIARYMEMVGIFGDAVTWVIGGYFGARLFEVTEACTISSVESPAIELSRVEKMVSSVNSLYQRQRADLPCSSEALGGILPELFIIIHHVMDHFSIPRIGVSEIDLGYGWILGNK